MPPAMERQEEGQFRILHWNVHSWRDATGAPNQQAVADLVGATDPQVVSLVEVDESWGLPEVLQDLAERLGYAWLFTPAFEFGQEAPAGGFGNALLSKLPILAAQQWQLLWPPRTYDGTEPSEARSVVFAKLRLTPTSVWVGSTHLPRSDTQARAGALQRFLLLTERLDGPWLVCGDFNTPAAAWLDRDRSLAVSPQPAQPTYPARQPTEPIDYCVASGRLALEGKVLQVDGSDHLPLLTTVRLWDLTPFSRSRDSDGY